MSRIVVFGAGGRAGRAAVAEAVRRGHGVTAVVRSPEKYGAAADGVRVVAGDNTDAGSIAEAAAGHDAAISAVYDFAADPSEFFVNATRALADGLGKAGVRRLVWVGLASVLPTASGELLMDTPGYPNEYRSFYLGHAAGADVLRATEGLDWVTLSPAGDFDHEGTATGSYRIAAGDAGARITYADFALALLDEIEAPTHHRSHVGVTS
ncbi:NAD(P)H-binding protein [Kribbella sp. NBC_01245]|uniref:NAD(P)-dependent oxidoreductase n=1 Tax=Kribbella sp. NBC_01245 TaxID=2903578 RepID=UPI002E2E7A19|nr:NAD(P)H-binding protein [Kribbella sp. NBC_01245]